MIEPTPPPSLREVANYAGVSVSTVERVLSDSPLAGAASKRKVREAIEALGYVPPATRRNPTIANVAERAGVSIATVSRVIGDSGQVQDHTRQRVLAAMAELGFVANAHARALNRSGSGQVAVLSATMLGSSFVGIAQGIESVASKHGHQFVVHTTGGNDENEAAHLASLMEQRSRAVILIGGANNSEQYRDRMAEYARQLDSVGCRLIVCGRPAVVGLPSVPSVDYDNRGGIQSLTEHLVELGHTRIAFVAGGPPTTRTARHAGYAAAMEAAGLPEIYVDPGDWEVEAGERAVSEIWSEHGGVTAIVASRDLLAVGVIRELRRRGIAVPEQVSVTGFDDMPLTEDLTPSLTTVRPRSTEIGETVAGLALARDVADNTSVVVPVEVLYRSSTAPPPPEIPQPTNESDR